MILPIFIYEPGNMKRYLEKRELLMSSSPEERPPVEIRGDVLTFSSKDMAEDYIEWLDVESNAYVGFDSTGAVLKLTVSDTEYGRVIISDDPTSDPEPEVLRNILRNFLVATGSSVEDLQEATLAELVLLMKPIRW